VALEGAIPYFTRMSAEGLYRKRNAWGEQEHGVRVKYDGAVELEVPESFYREQGWQPPCDELPWHDEKASEDKEPESEQQSEAQEEPAAISPNPSAPAPSS
jgi:hypothetical protein